MKPLLFVASLVFGCASFLAQKPGWQPSPGHMQVPIWPDTVPDARPTQGPEVATPFKDPLVGGNLWVEVANVWRPTMTIYAPIGKHTGATVVVFPGGV